MPVTLTPYRYPEPLGLEEHFELNLMSECIITDANADRLLILVICILGIIHSHKVVLIVFSFLFNIVFTCSILL